MPKYKEGDELYWSFDKMTYRILYLTDETKKIEGQWSSGFKSTTVPGKCYIFEDEVGNLQYDYFINVDRNKEFSLIERQKTTIVDKNYPHVCKRCGAPAYIGLNNVDCSNCGRY